MTPEAAVDVAIDAAKHKTVSGVATALGFMSEWRHPPPKSPDYVSPEKRARDLASLADEAISLLEMSVRTKTPPHAGTVAHLRDWLRRATAA